MGHWKPRFHRMLQTNCVDLGPVRIPHNLLSPWRLFATEKSKQNHPMERPQFIKNNRCLSAYLGFNHRNGAVSHESQGWHSDFWCSHGVLWLDNHYVCKIKTSSVKALTNDWYFPPLDSCCAPSVCSQANWAGDFGFAFSLLVSLGALCYSSIAIGNSKEWGWKQRFLDELRDIKLHHLLRNDLHHAVSELLCR